MKNLTKENLYNFQRLLWRNSANLQDILNEKSLPKSKDNAWADFPYAVEDLIKFLKEEIM